MAGRTYGTLELDAGRWAVACEPHVMVRLKRVFRQVRSGTTGRAFLKDTPEHARDLAWFLGRYPLEVAPAAAARLAAGAEEHRARERGVAEVLDPGYRPPAVDLAVPLRPYQEVGVALAKRTRGLLIGDDVGLGKTAQAIGVLVDPAFLPAAVVTHVHLAEQWREAIARFAPGLRVHVPKTAKVEGLDKPRGRPRKGTPPPAPAPWDVVVISYSKVAKLGHALRGRVKSVVWDEVQMLRRSESEKYQAALALAQAVDLRLGLSATPIQNYGGEIHAVVECLAPDALGSRDEFRVAWTDQGYKAMLKEPAAFGSYLRDAGLMIRRTRADVARDLPALTKVVHEVDADLGAIDRDETVATELARVILAQGGRKKGEALRASAEFSWRLRLATGVAKAASAAEFVRMVADGGEPVLLFGWHHEVYDLWAEKLADLNPAFYTGRESEPQKRKSFEEFTSGRSRVLVCSLQAGAGLDGLQHCCRTVVFGELDWSPAVHEQAIGRVFRDGQASPVFAYFLTADAGSDPSVISALGVKRDQIEGIRDPSGPAFVPRQVDPDHVKNLARDYLARRGVAIPRPEEEPAHA